MIDKNEDAPVVRLFVVNTNDVHARIVPADGGMDKRTGDVLQWEIDYDNWLLLMPAM
jgi:hypothetical protein